MKHNGRTGEKVSDKGVYQNRYGEKVSLNIGDIFPACPKEGKSIDWVKMD